MLKTTRTYVRALLAMMLLSAAASAQNAPAAGKQPSALRLRMSIITAAPGTKVFEALGHVCIRVTDSTRTGDWHDVVFNYGTFDFYEKGLVTKMISGNLNYYLSIINYKVFLENFVAGERGLSEQELLLSPGQKMALISRLERNALPENKHYNYNFFVDNCSTRVYDVIREALGNSFKPGNSLPSDHPTTYFDLCRQYYRNRHWERVGVSILFAGRMNMVVDNEAANFLPAYLSKGLETATVDGRRLCAAKTVLRQDRVPNEAGVNGPLALSLLIALLTITGYFARGMSVLRRAMHYSVPILTGLAGCLILYAWIGTTHAGTGNNLNILWAMPLNLAAPFLPRPVQKKYAAAALCFIALTLVLNVLGLHALPLPELSPLLLSLVVVFAAMLRHHIAYRTDV